MTKAEEELSISLNDRIPESQIIGDAELGLYEFRSKKLDLF